jgi:hypothetical protein
MNYPYRWFHRSQVDESYTDPATPIIARPIYITVSLQSCLLNLTDIHINLAVY